MPPGAARASTGSRRRPGMPPRMPVGAPPAPRPPTKDSDWMRLAGPQPLLPSLPGAATSSAAAEDLFSMPTSRVRQDAANWVANEGSAWSNFAHSTLTGRPLGAYEEAYSLGLRLAPAAVEDRMGVVRPPPMPRQAGVAARDAMSRDLTVPMPVPPQGKRSAYPPSPRTLKLHGAGTRGTPLTQTVEDHPEALMDIIYAERRGPQIGEVTDMRLVPHEYRMNRQIKGTTRTARVLRRTGLGQTTKYRDEVLYGMQSSAMTVQKKQYMRKLAAERIQRAWRAWYKYCRENADWMTTTWICATMIQAKWRSYHVRRKKKDRAATKIQSLGRGHNDRRRLLRARAAVTIQRFAVGMITRRQLRKLCRTAVKMQSLIRGFVARRRVKRKLAFMMKTALTIQCAVRRMIAKRRVRERRRARQLERARQKAATDIQRHHRGIKGRERYENSKQQYIRQQREFQAASKLQAMARRDAAIKEVDLRRARKLEQMNKAATFVRKMWLGAHARHKYKNLLEDFAAHEKNIINMQRHARGFLVRLRMWREATRMEEELWGALEIQRLWRGYKGRVAFENKYEEVWRREMAAAWMQRHLRGWLARTRVNRLRRRIARAEFEHARRRFRAIQRVQALIRGVLTRKITHRIRARKVMAAVHLQRIWKGHILRKQLWGQVITLRSTMIQASMRGFLVRNRRFKLIAKVLCIQRTWRRSKRWQTHGVRARARADRQKRKENAALIQSQFRKHREGQEVGRIQQDLLARA